MGRFTVIPQDTFSALQLDAGVLLTTFDPSNPVAPADSNIICATTGGITVSCIPTFSDLGEDVDNVPVNMKEFKHLDSWECKLSTSSLGTSPELIKLALGCADIDGEDESKIIPRKDLLQTDFANLWWVGDKADGGLVAVKLKNALATSGFTLKTTKNGKGQTDLELTGHVSINAQSEMPMEFYSMDGNDQYVSIIQRLTGVTSSETATSVKVSDGYETTLSADSGYHVADVYVYVGDADKSTYYNSGTGKVTITSANLTGDVTIIARAEANS